MVLLKPLVLLLTSKFMFEKQLCSIPSLVRLLKRLVHSDNLVGYLGMKMYDVF